LEINKNYNDKLGENEKELRNVTKELKEVKKQFEDYKVKYIYTAGELENSNRQI
jgi:phage-related tail protein